MNLKIPVEVSARHVHISQKDLDALFGKNFQLTEDKKLSQPGDFASREKVNVKIGEKELKNVRIVGPVREKTQIEISRTDALFLGAKPPVLLSGDLDDAASASLTGPVGSVEVKGLIIAKRHIHCSPEEAKTAGMSNGDVVCVKIAGERGITFCNVPVRVADDYKLSMHIDTDEGNAAGIDKTAEGEIVLK